MNKINSTKFTHNPIAGASWMIIAGTAFAVINAGIRYLGLNFHISSSNIALWQYFLALVVMIPWLLRQGFIRAFKTKHWKLHVLRVLLAVIGIQLWTWGISRVPLAQGIALLMTSPLFSTIGSGLFLKEKVSTGRWLATFAGFIGGMIILEPWSDRFTWASLLPVGAAFFWSCYSLLIKKQSRHDSPVTLVVYLFALMLPFNLTIALPTWHIPCNTTAWLILIGIGCLTTLAQWCIAKAYSVADASFIQPFDHAKLPLNVLLGWLIFSEAPDFRFWIGAVIIVTSVSLVTNHERKKKMFS